MRAPPDSAGADAGDERVNEMYNIIYPIYDEIIQNATPSKGLESQIQDAVSAAADALAAGNTAKEREIAKQIAEQISETAASVYKDLLRKEVEDLIIKGAEEVARKRAIDAASNAPTDVGQASQAPQGGKKTRKTRQRITNADRKAAEERNRGDSNTEPNTFQLGVSKAQNQFQEFTDPGNMMDSVNSLADYMGDSPIGKATGPMLNTAGYAITGFIGAAAAARKKFCFVMLGSC